VATGKELATFKGHTERVQAVVFSPDGKTLAGGKDLATLKGHTESVYSVVFSPDGKILASASFDSTIKLWDVSPMKRVGVCSNLCSRAGVFVR